MMDDFPIDKKVPSGSYTYRMSQVEEYLQKSLRGRIFF